MSKYISKFLLFSALVLAISATGVSAQNQSEYKITTSFEFQIKGRIFPPGQYSVTMLNTYRYPADVLIKGVGNNRSAIFAAQVISSPAKAEKELLIFNRYGSHLILSAINLPGSNIFLSITASPENKGGSL